MFGYGEDFGVLTECGSYNKCHHTNFNQDKRYTQITVVKF